MGTRSNDVRTRLIESAITIFSKKWYSSASIAEICRAAGVSIGIYYHYFENKEDIFKSNLSLFSLNLTLDNFWYVLSQNDFIFLTWWMFLFWMNQAIRVVFLPI